jgi:predicted amidohydrolase YtcJ
LILFNTNIYTGSSAQKKTTALYINDDRIIAIGQDNEILDEYQSVSDAINLKGMTVWPGLCDSHLHLQNLSTSLDSIDCETDTIEECLERILSKVNTHEQHSWIRGYGWNQNQWQNSTYGTASQLDHITADHPVYLSSKSLHAAWVNSKALQMANITSETPDPPGGEILRDKYGKPTGILLESAVDLIQDIIPSPKPGELANNFRKLQTYFFQMGLTSVHDFDGVLSFAALKILYEENALDLRIIKNMPVDDLPDLVRQGINSGSGDDRLRMGSLKVFADGALGPQTASMLSPYEESTSVGLLLLNADELLDIGQKAVVRGWGLAIHAIGDRANHEAIKAISRLRDYESKKSLPHYRHRIEHVQCIEPEDQIMINKLDITASVQPIHCTSDMYIADKFWGMRTQYTYPIASFDELGVFMVFGSDAPVESCNPFWGLHAALTRRRKDGSPNENGWHSEQRISLNKALAAYSVNPAIQAGMGDRLGQIRPGYLADLILLPVDPFHVSPEEIHTLAPVMTMVNGKIVFQKIA